MFCFLLPALKTEPTSNSSSNITEGFPAPPACGLVPDPEDKDWDDAEVWPRWRW